MRKFLLFSILLVLAQSCSNNRPDITIDRATGNGIAIYEDCSIIIGEDYVIVKRDTIVYNPINGTTYRLPVVKVSHRNRDTTYIKDTLR